MPGYVNIGAWVGPRTMVDTWATVGSCAQIGADVHLAGGVGIGGVLEPLNARPVIVEDGAFLGSRCIVTEGVRIGAGAMLARERRALTASVPIIDVTGDRAGRAPRRRPAARGRRPRHAAEGVPGGHVPARLRADRRLAPGVARRAAEPERDAAAVRARGLAPGRSPTQISSAGPTSVIRVCVVELDAQLAAGHADR